MKFIFLGLFVIIFNISCSSKNANNHTKKVFIFDFDDTISTTPISLEAFSVASDNSPVKLTIIKEMIKEKSKNQIGPVSYLLLNQINQIIGRKITKNDFDIASNNIIKGKITPGIAKIIKKIIKQGNDVFIIGGGYSTCGVIINVAKYLEIPTENIFSGISSFNKKNELELIDNKIGFSHCVSGKKITNDFLKSKVVKYLKNNGKIKNDIIFVGDGKNDLEVWQSGQIKNFIGFGINKIDILVKQQSPIFVEKMSQFNKHINRYLD